MSLQDELSTINERLDMMAGELQEVRRELSEARQSSIKATSGNSVRFIGLMFLISTSSVLLHHRMARLETGVNDQAVHLQATLNTQISQIQFDSLWSKSFLMYWREKWSDGTLNESRQPKIQPVVTRNGIKFRMDDVPPDLHWTPAEKTPKG